MQQIDANCLKEIHETDWETTRPLDVLDAILGESKDTYSSAFSAEIARCRHASGDTHSEQQSPVNHVNVSSLSIGLWVNKGERFNFTQKGE